MHRTIRLKLNTTTQQAHALKQTLEGFTRAFNFVCEYGWDNSEKNGVKLHHATYYSLKEACPELVSDLIIQARMKATEALKSVFALKKSYPDRLKKFEAQKKKILAKGKSFNKNPPKAPGCPKSRGCPPRYNVHTYKLDWTSRTVNLATSPGNRLIIGFTVPPYALRYVDLPFDTADLIYRRGSFWLHVVVTLPAVEFVDSHETIGIDLGLNHPVVTSQRNFLGSSHWKEIDRRTFRLKRALQSKGTPSAKRHLKKLAGRQMRFHRDCDHVLSKRIVERATPGTTLVIENLTEIRSRARLRKGEGQRRLHAWSFAQFRSFLGYKAEERGMRVVAIDPRHTSQTCSRCGFQHRSNRRSQSLFLCRACAYQLNADLNASYNIRYKHLASLGTSLGSGPQSIGLSQQVSA